MLADVLDLTAASWGKTEVTVTSSSGSAPDGSNTTLFNVVPSTNSAAHELLTSPISITNGSKYAFSFIAKANGYNYLKVRMPDAQFGTDTWIVVNLTNGAIESTSGSPLRTLVKSLGNGFYHIQIADTAIADGTGIQFSIGVYNDAACTTFAGDGTKGMYIWRPQVEAKAFATTFVNGTRNYDKLALPITNDILHPEHGSVAIRFYVPEGGLVGSGISNAKILLNIGAYVSDWYRICLYYDTLNSRFTMILNGASPNSMTLVANKVLSTGWHTAVIKWNKISSTAEIFCDGVKLVQSIISNEYFISSWIYPYAHVGDYGDGSGSANTYHDFVAFWNRTLTDAEATSITTSPLSVPDYTAFYDFNNNLKNEQLSYGIKITNGYIDAGAIKSGTMDIARIAPRTAVIGSTNYMRPVTMPGTVVFPTSDSYPIVSDAGVISSDALSLGSNTHSYIGLLPTYISKIDFGQYGSNTTNYGILWIYDLESMRSRVESGNVLIRYWDERYAVYYLDSSSVWQRLAYSTSASSPNVFQSISFTNARKIAVGYTNTSATDAGGIEFAIRILA